MTEEQIPAAGRLLVATLLIGDPNFSRAVVLVLDHDDDGTVGVVLNRPTELAVSEALPPWADVVSGPGVVFEGGPVGAGGVVGLARAGRDVPAAGWAPMVTGLATVDVSLEPGELGGDVAALRLFSGYAGWGPGQLDGELAVGAWWVFDALPGDPFTARPDELWWDVVGRQGGAYRMYRHAPLDLDVN